MGGVFGKGKKGSGGEGMGGVKARNFDDVVKIDECGGRDEGKGGWGEEGGRGRLDSNKTNGSGVNADDFARLKKSLEGRTGNGLGVTDVAKVAMRNCGMLNVARAESNYLRKGSGRNTSNVFGKYFPK